MLVQRTEKGRAELKPGVRTLGQRERSVLLLADGNKSIGDLSTLFEDQGTQIALGLMREGYLELRRPSGAAARTAVAPAARAAARRVAAVPAAPESVAPESVVPESVSPPAAAADSFEGRRSLATTRMFLFDICERMFARRDPAGAERLREALRQAKDREAMLAAARQMVEEIERVAGPERADSISERIAMLLPSEAAVPA